MEPLSIEYVTAVRNKLAEFVTTNVAHLVHVTWRMKTTDAFEEASDPMEWVGVAHFNAQGAVVIVFSERPGLACSFPRADVEYLRLSVKRTNQEMPASVVQQQNTPASPLANPSHVNAQAASTILQQQQQQLDNSLTFFEMISNTKIAAFITVAGTKVLREPGKFACLYPHIWVSKLEDDAIGGVIAEWRSELTELLSPIQTRSDSITATIELAKRAFTEWLRAVCLGGPQMNEHMWRVGYSTLENILLMIALSLRASAGVLKVKSELDDAWTKRTIDYPAIIKAVQALPSQPTNHFQSNVVQRGRGQGWRGGRGSFRSRGGARQL